MSRATCPYLGTDVDPASYYPEPHEDNACYSDAKGGVAVPLDFQASVCLSPPERHEHCTRFRTATRRPAASRWRRWLVVGVAAAALIFLAGCFLALAATLGRAVLFPPASETPPPTAIVSRTPRPSPTLLPTWTPLPSATPPVADTPTELPLPTAVLTPTETLPPIIVGSATPQSTPTWPPTVTPRPLPTRPRATATRAPTATRYPTATYAPTATRTPTLSPTPLACQGDETMTFIPVAPALNQTFTIEVRSIRGHTNISLSGPGDPNWEGTSKEGSYYYWRWSVAFSTAGTYTYAFYVNSGAVKCKEAPVTVLNVTMTPTVTNTPTPTATATEVVPAYGVTLGGETSLQILPGTEALFDLTLTNTGNVEDTFDVGLSANPPGGWQAKWCDDKGCYDYTAGTLPETVPAGGSIPLQIKLIAPVDAPVGQSVSATLSARSQHDGMAYAEHAATAEVISPQ